MLALKGSIMIFKEYRYLVFSDYYRIKGRICKLGLLKDIIIGGAFKYIFWLRTSKFLSEIKYFKLTLYPFARIILRHYEYKYGISIPYDTTIGSGFYIGHFGGIVVNRHVNIGKNCNISQGVTIGISNRGKNKGYPTVGNNVYMGPGAKIIGGITIGNNVAIGANCVVTRHIPDDSVVVGIPGRVISQQGCEGYIDNTDYEPKLN